MGQPNVNKMLRGMSIRQLHEWMAFYELEPFGDERGDIRFSYLMQTLVNLKRNPRKQPQAPPLTDFVLPLGDAIPPKKPKPWQDMLVIAQQMASVYSK